MRIVGRCFLASMACVAFGLLYGCGFLDMVAGVQTGPNGEIISTGPGIGDHVSGLAGSLLGPWGVTAGAVLGWGFREYRHYRLIKAGRPDANRNGVDDEQETPKPPKIA